MTPIRSLVSRKVSALQSRYRECDAAAVRDMAALRQSLAKEPGTDPATWELTMADVESRFEPRDTASPEEWAVHIALTSFALHQQSHSEPMHVPGVPFGQAIQRLANVNAEGPSKGVRRRLDALVTASSGKEFQHHLGALIRMLRTERIGFDYGLFAEQIVWFLNPRTRKSAQLQWARDFSRLSTSRLSSTSPDSQA